MGDGLLQDAASSPVTWGRSWLNNRKDFRYHIHDVAWNEAALYNCTVWTEFLFLLGLAATAGIGFTVSLFITNLAFDDITIINESKIGILFASVLAGILGLLLLVLAQKMLTK